MTLHRTPVHHTAALMVRDGAIRWQPGKTVGGGWFVHSNGQFPEPQLVTALAELRQHGLIVRTGPDLALTELGKLRLAEWDATRKQVEAERAKAVKS